MTHSRKNLLVLSTCLLAASALAACGGSSGSSAGPTVAVTPPAPVSSAPTFTKDTFDSANRFDAMCQTPRSGTDIQGNRFSDQAGSTLLEKFWLRSWSNETYLWNTEIEDIDPASITDRVNYFNVLKSNELSETGSGREKDDFHFSESTEDFTARQVSQASSGYGARLTSLGARDADGRSIVPRDFRILYTEPNSPASAAVNGNVNFPRGARIIEVDGVDLINGTDTETLNNGLFPETAGESHIFKIREAGTNIEREVTIISANIAQEPVNRTKIIDTADGKVGYILFNTFGPDASEKSLADAFKVLSDENIDDLVLDLRYNGGGLVAVAAQLGYMIAGPTRTNGKTAALLQYNDAAGNRNPISGDIVDPFPFIDEGQGFSVPRGTQLDTVNLPRVFILTTGGTCSASELVINSLIGIDHEVVIIGDTTCGKPYGFQPTDNCGRTYYTIQFQSVNDKGIGDYSDGFSPIGSTNAFSEKLAGCLIDDDLDNELGDESEALLSAALFYRANGACPVSTSDPATAKFSKMRQPLQGKAQGITLNPALGGPLKFNDPYEFGVDSYLDATMPDPE